MEHGLLTVTGGKLTTFRLIALDALQHVMHLQDLLLRRTRLGLLLRTGGAALLPRIRTICQGELGWSDAQWHTEQADYLAVWQRHYSPPATPTTPTTNTTSTTAPDSTHV